MRSFRNGLAVLSLCVAMLAAGAKNAPVRHHAGATLDDDIVTTIVNALIELDSRISLPPG